MTVATGLGGAVVVAVHTKHFHDLAYYGAQVGRPGYVVNGNSCCLGALGLAVKEWYEARRRRKKTA